jgi:hypothetical protein
VIVVGVVVSVRAVARVDRCGGHARANPVVC